ncbi:FtsK/SpoIIIE domain-containing protein [Streptomyces sp. NBC_01142]|uniref:FtsK/SpoIIIE domain-containing protein n=1 Tax=Streptomyces sp. NBC_01142 TaxID=2975865 RepID=UPI00224E30F9|nr:FtsK/SpoIIIE domain-containing protein [Streptomyces sp. NBC_01142]MCX4823480.1 FtsK/SpoIIIE domain-containing protein [Streptomyces sp. NBC_01142]
MQIRLTVLAPRGGQSAAAGHTSAGRACDVLITAPAGTALAAVASGLAAAVSGPEASGSVVLYAGRERLDTQRRTLGEPPLVDGAVLSLQVPGEDETPGADASAQLHVVAGPDAGGVHLLHGGRIRIGRSADADVPMDDPDVSRLHCEVTVAEDGRVTVADLGSTNGTTLDGAAVGARPVRLPAGALLRLGESTLRVTPGDRTPALATTPDGEGHLRVTREDADGSGPGGAARDGSGPAGGQEAAGPAAPRPRVPTQYDPTAPAAPTSRGRGDAGTLYTYGSEDDPARDAAHGAAHGPLHGDTVHSRTADARDEYQQTHGTHRIPGTSETPEAHSRTAAARTPRQGTPADGTSVPESFTRRRGIGAWARRLAGGREEPAPAAGTPRPGPRVPDAAPVAESWPDPAAVLLTALGPGPRLWERDPRHPESLVLRLGTTERAELPSVPVTVGLLEAGSLGLAGPRARLAGLARSAVAQLAALHSPVDLEIVLISADRARSLAERRAEWAWLGWLPHLRPAHGQDCRLLLAYDRDQATARGTELTRRLDDGPLGPGWPSADRRAVTDAAARYEGPRTVVIVDGDPGSAALRETTARLAGAGSAAGIHLICLAETPAASPLSPVAATYETACAASLAFRECGAVALLSGDVATALRLMRTAGGQPAGHGTVGAVDAVSAAWAERFGRALAPLRAEGTGTHRGRAVALPRSARLLDELGLARATPASLMARWASAGDGTAVLGSSSRGPLAVDLSEEGPHLLIDGPPGSGRTELLRSVAASLAAAGRPDRLGLLLVDGAGGERGEGLTACTELPHVTEYLVASDPVRMRAFAQALGAELKRRSELLAGLGFAEWHTQREVADRMAGQRSPGAESGRRPPGAESGQRSSGAESGQRSPGAAESGRRPVSAAEQRGDLDSPASGTLRLRPGGRTKAEAPAPLPRLVVLVDDFDALVAPALGSPGRPAAGSVVRALEAVVRDGERLGVHLVATSARPDRTADTELAHSARLRVVLDAPPASPGPDDPAPGRGRLGHPDGRVTPFQGGRVTGRIPRTATLRPTVVLLEWERMGDPPTRRPVRELGNGPTDLALLASALERAARSVDAAPLPPLTPAHP